MMNQEAAEAASTFNAAVQAGAAPVLVEFRQPGEAPVFSLCAMPVLPRVGDVVEADAGTGRVVEVRWKLSRNNGALKLAPRVIIQADD